MFRGELVKLLKVRNAPKSNIWIIARNGLPSGVVRSHSLCHNLQFDIRALSVLIVRGVEPGITRTYSGVYKGYILGIVSLRVCSGPQQTRSFSSVTTKQKSNTLFVRIVRPFLGQFRAADLSMVGTIGYLSSR